MNHQRNSSVKDDRKIENFLVLESPLQMYLGNTILKLSLQFTFLTESYTFSKIAFKTFTCSVYKILLIHCSKFENTEITEVKMKPSKT